MMEAFGGSYQHPSFLSSDDAAYASESRRCIHLIAELGLTSNQSAASRRDAPDSTAFTTRSRNSKEHGFGIDPPSRIQINAARFNYVSPVGES